MYEEKYESDHGYVASYTESRLPWSKLIRLAVVAVVGAAALVVLLAVGCSGEERSKIAFVSDRDGDPDVFVMNEDGSNQVPLTKNGAADTEPRLSPDKKWVAFISEESGDREINRALLGEKETEIERLTNSLGADEMHWWSPDGSRIAFVSNRDGQPEVYLMNADGSNFTRVTHDQSAPLLSGWSPDGQWIAFSFTGADGESPGIFTRNPDGVNIRALTDTEDYEAIWSPDGNRIAFVSMRDGNSEIYVMDAMGPDAGVTRLTTNTSPDYSPSWSPDGKKITFVSERDGNSEIYVMRADGGAQVRHTYNGARDDSPVWSPDGNKIAFVSYMYGTAEIIVMNSDGNNQIRLTNNSSNDTQPSW